MPRSPGALHSLLQRRPLTVAILLAITALGPAHAAADRHQQATDQMLNDCRSEGEAGGLQGAELEVYVNDCIQDLLTVEIGNLEE